MQMDQNEQTEQSVVSVQTADRHRPGSVAALIDSTRALSADGRWDEAVEQLSGALKAQSNIKNIHSLINAMLQIGAGDRAIEILTQTVEENPSRTDIMFMLGLMFDRIGHLGKTEQWYKRILEQQP